MGLPILIGLGARQSAQVEIAALRASHAALEQENTSYRTATAELTAQVTAIQGAIADLSERASLDAATLKAINQLPAIVKTRAIGGSPSSAASDSWIPPLVSPESTFGLLRDLLEILEGRLRGVRSDVERQQALAAATPSIWPTRGWLSGSYGRRRDPFTGKPDLHRAIDISSDKGRPVYATADGVIDRAAYTGAYGNLVTIRHEFGLQTRYGHLDKFAVEAGDSVKRGDIVGYVGATGRATGSHLHYEVWVNGQPINPLQLLLPR